METRQGIPDNDECIAHNLSYIQKIKSDSLRPDVDRVYDSIRSMPLMSDACKLELCGIQKQPSTELTQELHEDLIRSQITSFTHFVTATYKGPWNAEKDPIKLGTFIMSTNISPMIGFAYFKLPSTRDWNLFNIQSALSKLWETALVIPVEKVDGLYVYVTLESDLVEHFNHPSVKAWIQDIVEPDGDIEIVQGYNVYMVLCADGSKVFLQSFYFDFQLILSHPEFVASPIVLSRVLTKLWFFDFRSEFCRKAGRTEVWCNIPEGVSSECIPEEYMKTREMYCYPRVSAHPKDNKILKKHMELTECRISTYLVNSGWIKQMNTDDLILELQESVIGSPLPSKSKKKKKGTKHSKSLIAGDAFDDVPDVPDETSSAHSESTTDIVDTSDDQSVDTWRTQEQVSALVKSSCNACFPSDGENQSQDQESHTTYCSAHECNLRAL